MDSNQDFNISTFTDTTKKVCMCSAISIFLIVMFIISPLSNFFFASTVMKIVILLVLFYTIYVNINQTEYLRNSKKDNLSNEVSSQVTINIICGYVFTLFIGLLIIFVFKSFF